MGHEWVLVDLLGLPNLATANSALCYSEILGSPGRSWGGLDAPRDPQGPTSAIPGIQRAPPEAFLGHWEEFRKSDFRIRLFWGPCGPKFGLW